MIRLINVQARRALTAAVWLSILAGVARGQTWTGAISTDWNTAGNWNPSGVPNEDAEFVNFAGSGLGTVNISSSVVVTWMTFSNSSFNYTLTSSAGKVLTLEEFTDPDLGTFPPEIIVSAAVTGTETINLANVASGSLLASTGLEIQNNSTSSGTTLVIGPNTVIGAAGTHTVTVEGPGNTQITGSFATGTNQITGLTADGPGTLTFSGNGANLNGRLTLLGGTLVLDYSSNIATKLGSGSLTLDGGVFSMTANSSTPVTQAISAGTMISAGQTDILATGTGTITLNAGAIGRVHGATADFALAAPPTFSVLTSTGVVNGLLGTGPAFATVNGGSTWATVSGGAVAGLTTYSSIYSANNNVDVTSNPTLSNVTVNSLRFNAASNLTMTLSGTNTLQSGGILVTPTSGGGTITGGSLTASGGELILHDYAPSGFTINSSLVSAVGLTKTGPQNLILGGNNTGLTGPININRGTLIVTNPAAVNSSSSINFNDIRSGAAPQSFTVDLGNNTAGTIAPPVNGALFSTGNSRNSRVTLAGGIDSDSTATITFSGDPSNTSGFNVSSDNSFFGSVTLSHGFLGISSDSALGDDSTLVMLNIGSATSGGLDFLSNFTGGFSHPITVSSTSRVVVDGGATATISGTVNSVGFGPGWQFVKG
jgi:autotransporter-associated beta strand protein